MSKDYIREGKFHKKDGDVEYDMVTVDGICMPPFPCMDSPGGFSKRILEIQELDYLPGDVILATYPKCGTHWTSEILNMIVQGTSAYSKETKASAMLEALIDMDMLDRLPSPRVLNTHLPYKWLPRKHIQNGGKIVQTTRNPKDAYVSFFHHMSGGPELGPKSKDMTWTQFFNNFVIGKDIPYGTWFDYAKEMEQAKMENKNIYTLHYEALKRNPVKEIKALADFLEKPISETLVEEIASQCEFDKLKKADKEIKKLPPEFVKFIEDFKKNKHDFTPHDMYRKGIVGDWKSHFTVEQNELFDELYKKEMGDSCFEVMY